MIEKLPGYISEAHDEDKSKTGPLECALWGATGYDNRLLGKVLRRLSEDIAKEAEYRRDSLDLVGRATHAWFKGNFGRIVEPPKEVVITLRGKGELGILLENLTDFSELEESLQINEFEVSMFSSVQQCQLENSDWEETDKRKLQSIYSDSTVPDSTTLKIRFASWTPGLKPCDLDLALSGQRVLQYGSWTCLFDWRAARACACMIANRHSILVQVGSVCASVRNGSWCVRFWTFWVSFPHIET